MRSSQAIRPGVAAADDHYTFARRADFFHASETVPRAPLVLLSEIVHREMDTLELTPWYRQIARMFGAHRKQNRVEIPRQVLAGHLRADFKVHLEFDPL